MTSILGSAITQWYFARQSLARALSLRSLATHPLCEELARNGIVILRDLIPNGLIENINQQNQIYFEKRLLSELIYCPDGKALLEAEAAAGEALDNFYFLHIKNYQQKFDVYKHIIPLIDGILAGYYKSPYYVRDAYCYRTQPIDKVQGSYQWHRDNYPPGSLKVMTYLTDVTPQAGPFSLALKSHIGFKPALGKIGDRYEEGFVKANFEIIDCVGSAGTVIIFNNNAIHRATDPVEGYRDVINFTAFPSIFRSKGRRVKGLDLNEEKVWFKQYTR